MKNSIWLYCFIITILLGCSPTEEIQEFQEETESIIPVTVARKFSGNTLTVSSTGIPPLAISLIRKDSTVYSDFLVEPGVYYVGPYFIELNTNIL